MALSIGDINNNFEKLNKELRAIKYPHELQLSQAQEGLPPIFLPIIHFSLLEYSQYVAQFIIEKEFDMRAKTDFRFMESTYKILLNHFNYKPQITLQQFFSAGYAERKIITCVEIIQLIRNKHQLLSKHSQVNNQGPQSTTITTGNKSTMKKAKSKTELQTIQEEKQTVKIIKHEPSGENQANGGFVDPPSNNYASYNQPMDMYLSYEQPRNQNPRAVSFIDEESKQIQQLSPQRLRSPKSPSQKKNSSLSKSQSMQGGLIKSLKSQRSLVQQKSPEKAEIVTSQIQNDQQEFEQRMIRDKQQRQIDKQDEMNKELMKLIINLNESVKVLGSRFEGFQGQINDKLNKIQAEQMLLANKVNFLEKNCIYNQIPGQGLTNANQSPQINPTYNQSNNMGGGNQGFATSGYNQSFNQSLSQQQTVSFDRQIQQQYMNAIEFQQQNPQVLTYGARSGRSIAPQNNNQNGFDPNSTEDYIKSVASRFEETKKLMSASNIFKNR